MSPRHPFLREPKTTLCPSCTLEVRNDVGLCAHHATSWEDTWARHNKIVCDMLHRGLEPARLRPEERGEDGP